MVNLLNLEEFGNWLYAARKAARLTQEELANRSGCTKGYISQLETGAKHSSTDKLKIPSRDLVAEFARVLGENPDRPLLLVGFAPLSADCREREPAAQCDEIDPFLLDLIKDLNSDQKVETANFVTNLKKRKPVEVSADEKVYDALKDRLRGIVKEDNVGRTAEQQKQEKN